MRATLEPAAFAEYASRGHWIRAKHLDVLNRRLLDVAAGTCTRLLVTMPPRHGKSELVSRFLPAWWLGTRPDDRVILASYESDFAATWGRKVRDLLDESGSELFGVSVRRDSAAASRFDLDGRAGGMTTAGVGGAITGKGANLLVIDDPVKSAEDSQSEALSRRVWDWYRSVARTRLEPGGVVVLVMTRWSEDDLAGRLLAESDGEKWEVLNLPALAEEDDPLGRKPGEALWPERFSMDDLEATRSALGSYLWSALYQGRPAPLDGNVFRRSWFRYFEHSGDSYALHGIEPEIVNVNSCRRFVTVDLAVSTKKSADYTVASVWAVTPKSELLLLHRVRKRIPAPEQVPLLRKLYEEWSPDIVGIEAVAFQLAIVQQAREDGLPVTELRADKDKVSRALTAAARLEGGTVYWPKKAPWLDEWENELLLFPNSRYDDQTDTFAYAALEVARRRSNEHLFTDEFGQALAAANESLYSPSPWK
jgi:predicted phage terminase large subunit-like protein